MSRGRTILIVDDDPQVAAYLRRLFEIEGWTSLLASSEAAAWSLLGSGRPSLALVDVVLGQTNGWELARRIWAKASVPVVVVTGSQVDDDMRRDAAALGAKAVVQKPFRSDELLALAWRLAVP